MEIIQAMAVNNPCYVKNTAMTPKGILVHSTGANNPTLKRYVDAPLEVGENLYNNHWNMSTQTTCCHAFIGLDINNDVKVAQILPYDMACWGCGSGSKGSYNYNPVGHIQFEMCEDDLSDTAYFTQMWSVATHYCAELCVQYGFDPLLHITSHVEAHALGYASNHADPVHWFKLHGLTMDDFRNAVKDILNNDEAVDDEAVADESVDDEAVADEAVEDVKLYRVQIGAYSIKSNAENMLKLLTDLGFEAYVREDDDVVGYEKLYRVQVGAYSVKSNAENMFNRLTVLGFAPYLRED